MRILIKNIKSLVQVREANETKVNGLKMNDLPSIENAWLAIENGIIADFGKMEDFPGITDWRNLEVIEADDKIILPTYCDSHTHLIFAQPREKEFVLRTQGASYEAIAASGGGILNSAKVLRETSEDDLYESALGRIKEIIALGTGAVEIKSGYGLTMDSELKMLRVAKRLKETTPITIKTTLLAAHAIPTEYKENREGYIQHIIEDILPQVVKEGLVDYFDVFCDRGFYTEAECDQLLDAAAKFGLRGKIHANELGLTGGVQSGVRKHAVSVDHLEHTSKAEWDLLKASDTMPTILQGTSFFLKIPFADARSMMNHDLPVTLATDFNPGSSPTGSMPFIMNLACNYMAMLPNECINACTMNGAAALELTEELGSITVGKKANFIITKKIPSTDAIPYLFSTNLAEQVFLNGKCEYTHHV